MAKHILSTIKPKDKENFNAAESVQEAYEWLTKEFGTKNCRRPAGTNQNFTNCTCVTFLADEQNKDTAMFLAEYLVRYAGMVRNVRRDLMYEWEKVAQMLLANDSSDKLVYMMPGIPVGAGLAQRLICRNALLGFLNEGRKSWLSAMKGPAFVHAGLGKKGILSGRGKANIEVYESLNTFFSELKQEAQPFATRIIREQTGLTTRDDDPDDVLLPPHFSKHQMYARWCYSQGWIVEKASSAKTTYKSLADFTPRPHDDDEDIPLWPEGSTGLKPVSWPTFLRYWKRNFPHLKIRKNGADTCTDCQILCNQFRTRQARADRRRARTNQASDEDESWDSTESEDSLDGNTDELEEQVEGEVEMMAAMVEEARKHVSAYQVQRNMARSIINLARHDIKYILSSLCRRTVLTIDMGQNLCLPNFEGEQPGDTFYLSPLTVLLFGVVDNVTIDKKDRMNAYIWQEFEGDRGANNIASCLLMDLKRRGFFDRPNYGELTYIADNCGGQNKNKIVVRFLMWLVENKVFPRVRLFFLVKGHTKNAADRMFNLLKNSYHNKDLFSYEQLHATLNENQYVDVFKMRPCHFHDHRKWQDKFYRNPAAGEFKRTHVFTICSANNGIPAIGNREFSATTLLKQDTTESTIRYDNLLPTTKNRKARKKTPEVRAREIAKMEENLEQLVPTGLKPIKQVELYKKWRPLLPEEFRDSTCPRPSDEVINSIKERNREKSKLRTKQKKLQTAKEISDKNSEKTS